MNRLFCAFVKLTAFPVQFLCFRTKIHYRCKSSQGRKINGPALLISNHTSVYDFAVWMFVFFRSNLRCLMAEILFERNFLLSWFLKKLGGIKIRRKDFDFGFVEESAKVLEKGGVVEVFPEARLPLPGEQRPLPFKHSAAYIAMRSGVPIIPVYTNGSYFRFRRAHVIIGEKIDINSLIDPQLSQKENIEKITGYLQKAVTELGEELEKEIKA